MYIFSPGTCWPHVLAVEVVCRFLGFSVDVMLSLNRGRLLSSLPICTPSISFSCLIIVAGTPSSVPNESGEGAFLPCSRSEEETFGLLS